MIDLIRRSDFKSTWILVFFIIILIMGNSPYAEAEFKGEHSTPIENLKLTLESEDHRKELKKILDANDKVKE